MSDPRDGTPEGLGPLTGPGGLPELAELVWSFFGLLEQRLGCVRATCEAADLERIEALTWQVEGAAGRACGPDGPLPAPELFQALAEQSGLEHLREKIEAVVLSCRRVKRK